MTPAMLSRATDDNGQAYTPTPISELSRYAESAESRLATRTLARTLRRVVKEESKRWTPKRAFVNIAMSLFVLVLLFGTMFVFRGMLNGAGLLVVIVLVIAGVISIDRRIAQRMMQQGIGATIVAHGLCARCAYSLQGLEPDEGGVVLCPECGAAWRLERVTRPHWGPTLLPIVPQPGLALRLRLRRPPVVVDDRGMLCRRLDGGLAAISRSRRAELGAEFCRELRTAIRRPSRWVRVSMVVAVVAGFVGLAAVWPGDPRMDSRELAGVWTLWVLGVCFLLVVLSMTFSNELGVRRRRVVIECVGRGLCASCGGPLAEAADDGIRVCRHCGASWAATQA